VTGGAETGWQCELSEVHPVAAGLEEDEMEEVIIKGTQVSCSTKKSAICLESVWCIVQGTQLD